MPDLPTSYATGTVSVGAGSTTVTGSGTSWVAAGLEAGDIFWAAGLSVRIASVNSATSITLAYPWPGGALSGANYEVRFTPDATRVLSAAREVLSALTNGNLSSLAGLVTAANKLAYYTGAGTAALIDLTSQARGLLGGTALTRAGSDYTLNGRLLGTAVTQSATDATASRLMKTGDAGILSTTPPTITLASAHTATGWYSYATTDPDKPPGSGSGAVEVKRAGLGPTVTVVVAYPLAGGIWTRRTSDSGATWTAWERCYTTATTVGTVGQSGGVPTGAVIERGSNANGEYVRFADGTQICWQAAILSQSVAANSYAEVTWTYPAAFVSGSAPNPQPSSRSFNEAASRQNAARFLRSVAGGSSSSSGVVGVFNAHTSALDARIDATVFGRWF